MEKVIEKITVQQGKQEEAPHRWMIGEQLKEICRREPKAAELVEQDLENPDFSLSNLEKKFDDFARNHRVGNQSIITPAQAETLIREFYGIPSPEENVEKKPMATESGVETQRKVISLFDLI